MKKILTFPLIILFFVCGTAFAQLPDGSIAPDWTFTDINGVTHHLYDDLDAGKTVFLDLSTTWCEPCWLYHEDGILEDLWQNHGPIGAPGVFGTSTNDIMLYFIECDAYTNNACLIGDTANCNSSTYGDWVTGTLYPIIDPSAPDIDLFNTNYQNNSYPTFFMICPDRTITCYDNSPPSDMYTAVTNCSFASSTVDARMRLMDLYPPVLESCDSVEAEFSITNMGTTPLTSANINYEVDGVLQKTYQWTGNIPTYNSELIQGIKVGGVTAGLHTVTAEVTNPNGSVDPVSSNNTASLPFNIYTATGGPAIAETFEASGIPSSWLVGNGQHLATTWSSATSSGFNSSKSAVLNWYDVYYITENGETDLLTLPAQSFMNASAVTLTFDVAFCEAFLPATYSTLDVEISTDCGISWTPFYSKSGTALTTAVSNYNSFVPYLASEWRHETVNLNTVAGQPDVLIRFKGTYSYGNNLYIDNVNVSSITGIQENKAIQGVIIYPNPSESNVTVSYYLAQSGNVSIQLTNELGQVVLQENQGTSTQGIHKSAISTSNLENGVYILEIKSGNTNNIQKLVVAK